MLDNRIVAVGLLTQRDLDVLGTGFRRTFAVDQPYAFADLLHQLDAIASVGEGVSGMKLNPHSANLADDDDALS